MLHKEIFGLIFLGFIFWILAATSPTQRIEHGCRPVGWTGSVVTSLSALALPNQQQTVQGWFDGLEYGCRYMTWRLFYQDEYNKWLATTKGAGQKAPAVSPPEKAPSKEVAPEPDKPSTPPKKEEGSPLPPLPTNGPSNQKE